MSASLIVGPLEWALTVDSDGYREYKIKFRVETTTPLDGPAVVLRTPGLPLPGASWVIDNDVDLWVWCRPNRVVTADTPGEPCQNWTVECTFSNKPNDSGNKPQKCHDQQIEDPLLEPMKISGGLATKSEEATHDRFGYLITNSAHEKITGQVVEFESLYPTVRIEQNVPFLNLPLLSYMSNKVNAYPLWGLQPRMIRCVVTGWERKVYGQCYYYYTRQLEFQVNYKTWDRDVLDEGTKVLHGKFTANGTYQLLEIAGRQPDRFNPQHFDRYLDRQGNPAKVMLDGRGQPSGVRVVDGTFGGEVSNNIRGAVSATSDAIADIGRLLVGACDVINECRLTAQAWRDAFQAATQLSSDWDNLSRLAANVVTLATNNSNANSIFTATNNVNTRIGELKIRLAALEVQTAAAFGITGGARPFTERASNTVFQINASAAEAVVLAQAAQTMVDGYYQRINRDINFTGTGTAIEGNVADPGTIHIEKYDEADFLLLGIPLVLG